MIRLVRVRTLQAIVSSLRGEAKIKKEKELLMQTRVVVREFLAKMEFKSDYWSKAKKQLKKDTHGKCAYCESPTDVVAHGDVEHFRPKSIYWWLAYWYDNYLFSCQICNQSYKGDNFPILASLLKAPIITDITTDLEIDSLGGTFSPDPLSQSEYDSFQSLLVAENAQLINPYEENPEIHFGWAVDEVLREVEMTSQSSTGLSQIYFEGAKMYYGINRPELKSIRYQTYKTLRILKDVLLQTSDLNPYLRASIQHQINEMKADSAPYAAMVRFFDQQV